MIAYTIVSRAYVPQARVLARSYARHHPGSKMWALLIDDIDRQFDEEREPFRILHLEDLGLDLVEIHRMQMIFSGKLIAVIKPWVFEYFLNRGANTVIYMDGDFVIYDSLQPVVDAAGSGVILVPHVLKPLPRDGKDPNETTLLGAGMFNAGMFGVGRNHGGFIEFLQERLRRECIFDARVQRFNEQRWLDFVPPLFPHHIVRDPGVDVAYWNLHERQLEKRGSCWYAGGVPLRAFHYSSFDPRVEGVGGKYELDPAPRVRLSSDHLFSELCEDYRKQLLADGFQELHDLPFSFDTLPDGSPIYHTLRRLFTDAVLTADRDGRPYPPDPFDGAFAGEFREWLTNEYEQTAVSTPQRLMERAQKRHSGLAQLRAKIRSHSGPDQSHPARWSVDWLERMIVDEAAERTVEGAVHAIAGRVGFVCHGPRAPLDPGTYIVTLEWDPTFGLDTTSQDEQVLVIEAFVQGYVVGSRTATITQIRSGIVELKLVIPECFAQEALLFGLELRLLTRGGLDGLLTGVLVDAVQEERVPELSPLLVDWLPVMAGGNAGLREGQEVAAIAGQTGVVVSGPNWRLIPGRYRVNLATRMANAAKEVGHSGRPIALLEAVLGENVLASRGLTTEDLVSGSASLEFEISDKESEPNDQVGIRLQALEPLGVVVTSVNVKMFADFAENAVPVA